MGIEKGLEHGKRIRNANCCQLLIYLTKKTRPLTAYKPIKNHKTASL